jgi:hypothetical protein
MNLRIRGLLAAVLALVLGLTALLLVTFSGSAGSAPKGNTVVITPTPTVDTTVDTTQPGGMDKDWLGYNSVPPGDGS